MQKALQLDPNRSDAYLNLAMLQMGGQQWDGAEASFKKAVDLSPKSTNALLSLGNFYQTRGRFPEAEQWFRRAIATAADDPSPGSLLPACTWPRTSSGQAEEFLRQSKKDFPNNSVGYRMLGDFLFCHTTSSIKPRTSMPVLYRDHAKEWWSEDTFNC